MVRAFAGRSGPLAVVCLAILVLWYAGAVWLNAPVLIDGYERRHEAWDLGRLAGDAMAMERPILPAPHQVVDELNDTVLGRAVTPTRTPVDRTRVLYGKRVSVRLDHGGRRNIKK